MLHAVLTTLAAVGESGEHETSKVPFYVAGGVLATWAVLVSVLGIMRPAFPSAQSQARAVMLISVVLVAATLAASLLTN